MEVIRTILFSFKEKWLIARFLFPLIVGERGAVDEVLMHSLRLGSI
jgi:hypothetical protein